MLQMWKTRSLRQRMQKLKTTYFLTYFKLKEEVVQDPDPKIERKRKAAEDTDLKAANLHMPRKKVTMISYKFR